MGTSRRPDGICRRRRFRSGPRDLSLLVLISPGDFRRLAPGEAIDFRDTELFIPPIRFKDTGGRQNSRTLWPNLPIRLCVHPDPQSREDSVVSGRTRIEPPGREISGEPVQGKLDGWDADSVKSYKRECQETVFPYRLRRLLLSCIQPPTPGNAHVLRLIVPDLAQ